jgi:hypothetical protein
MNNQLERWLGGEMIRGFCFYISLKVPKNIIILYYKKWIGSELRIN